MNNRIWNPHRPGFSDQNSSENPGLFPFSEEPVIPDTPSVYSDLELCMSCRYPSVGFLCKGTDGRCLRSEMKRLDERRDRRYEIICCGVC